MRKKIIFGVLSFSLVCVAGMFIREIYLEKKYLNLNSQAQMSHEQGAYKKAVTYSEESILSIDKMLFPSQSEKALLLSNLSIYSNMDDDFQGAIDAALQSLKIRTKILDQYDLRIAVNYLTLGDASESLNHYTEANNYYLKVLEIYNNNANVSDYDFGNLYTHMGVLHEILGDYELATETMKKAIAYHEKLSGNDRAMFAITLQIYGRIILEMGEYEEALEIFQKTLDINQKYRGESHPRTGSSYNNIGVAYYYLSEYALATVNFEKALNIRVDALGPHHHEVGQTLANLGMIYLENQNYTKAVKYLEDAMEIDKKIYGKRNPTIAINASNLGLVYEDMNEFKKAEEAYLEALSIREELLPSDHPDTRAVLSLLISLYEDRGEEEKADAMRERKSSTYR